MKKASILIAALVSVAGFVPAAQADDELPAWAYGFTAPPAPGTPKAPPNPEVVRDNVTKLTLPGSKPSFTRAEISNRYGPADWFPEDHPAMPEIVAQGRVTAEPQKIYACGLCHYPNGKGRPENANITGLTYEYFMQQMTDFKKGVRNTADPRKPNTQLMAAFAQGMTDEELKAAAEYFTKIPASPWIRVVEAATVAKSKPVNGVFLPLEGADAGTEPIGNRIIEMPENVRDAEVMRNPRSGWVAYVPPGSLQKGEALVMTGTTSNGDKVTACAACHGLDSRGMGPVPTIAGRSPSYIARQLYDMKVGARHGLWTPLMAPVVAHLGTTDMLTAAAYLASLKP